MTDQFEMSYVYATAIPASMIRLEAFGNRTYLMLVNPPVSKPRFPAYRQATVTLWIPV